MYVRPYLEDPVFLQPDDGEIELLHAQEDKKSNETPMYVRPYLEDPVFLQPDDEEIEMLHEHEVVHTIEEHHENAFLQ